MFVTLVVDLKARPGDIFKGEPKANKADCTLTLEDEDMVALVNIFILQCLVASEGSNCTLIYLGYW